MKKVRPVPFRRGRMTDAERLEEQKLRKKVKRQVAAKRVEGLVLLTIEEVAVVLSISRTTVYRWRQKPDFPTAKMFGRSPRWREEDIREWMNSQPDGK